MFFFKAAAAILAALPLAARATLSITAPTNWNTSGSATLTYTGAATDPVFSCELNNGGLLQYGSLAFCNNQSPTAGAINFQLPSVPAGDGYTVTFVAVSNINTVYATSAPFSIGAQYSPPPSTSSTSVPATVAATPAATTVKPAVATTPNAQASSQSAASASSAAAAATPFGASHTGAATSISPKAGALGGILAAGLAVAWL